MLIYCFFFDSLDVIEIVHVDKKCEVAPNKIANKTCEFPEPKYFYNVLSMDCEIKVSGPCNPVQVNKEFFNTSKECEYACNHYWVSAQDIVDRGKKYRSTEEVYDEDVSNKQTDPDEEGGWG